MRPATLLVVAEDETDAPDLDRALAAAERRLPGVTIDRVEVLAEHEVGRWLANHRARRCRTPQDVARTPERQQPVVLDIDLG